MDFSKIGLLAYDCDGVLTDNRVYVSEDGRETAAFSRGDGYGIRLLKEAGIPQVIISTEGNPIVKHRAAKLGLDVIYQVGDKKSALLDYCVAHGVPAWQVMFIGNDLNDLDAMLAAGYRGCPADAEPEIKRASHWISSKKGGYGVIRELAREILPGRNGG